ncbi:DoxX family membrane protein [Sanguibacter sp. Leaf3]|uniref:DoxX family membrane protein n=1 Tax=Sanguibacter sp. Leaf3 TaxID=1736209 RepID=UPI0006F7C344|nr:DoxX family membrane protein [Sanguibacter sp. Leaf3]KQT95911.1 DoxX family protein [Sanguibacter sp. Leaf3]
MLLRKIARPLLATWFVHDGLDALRHPAAHAVAARGPADQVTSRIGQAPLTENQLKTAVRVHGALTVAAAVSMATGAAPRRSALFLAALTVPVALADQPFTSGPVSRSVRTERFVRRLGALGAALLAGVDTEGRPGMSWRIENARDKHAAIKAAKETTAARAARVAKVSKAASSAKTKVVDAVTPD